MNSVSPFTVRPDAAKPSPASLVPAGDAVAARMQKLARLRTAISITNRAIIRSHSPAEVYRAVCRACVEQAGVAVAWIGIVDALGHRLVPVETCGDSEGFLGDGVVSLEEMPEERQPVVIAWREHRAYFCNDLEGLPHHSAWVVRAIDHGLRAAIALPLLRAGAPYGVLAVYGMERNFFDAESAEILLEMADNISFAIDQFDRARQRRLAEERFENLSRRLVEVQERERRGLARELHDRANPNLAAIKLILGSMEQSLPPDAAADVKPMLLDAHGLIDDTVAGIREICADLRPALLDYTGLVPTLEGYAEMFMKRTGVEVRMSVPPDWTRLAPDVESMLFRIAQEALTNCAKHACARRIDIALQQDGRKRVLSVRDDGFGFDPQSLGRTGSAPGLGLINMRERAEFVGARFSLVSHPLNGTEIRVEFEESTAGEGGAEPDYRKPCSEIT